MHRKDLHWIIPMLEKLRDNPDAKIAYRGTERSLSIVQFTGRSDDYSVSIPRKYRLYKRRGLGDSVLCVTNDDSRAPLLEKDQSVVWLTDWLPVPTGP